MGQLSAAAVRLDANNRAVNGLNAFFASKARDYSVEGGQLATAALTTAMTGANNDVTLTALAYGAEGNTPTITLVNPAGANKSLSVTVSNQDVTVNLATDGASAISTTGGQLVTALGANTSAAALFSAANAAANDGTGIVTALTKTSLAGGKGARLFKVTGQVMLQVVAYSVLTPVGASGTVQVGITGNTAALIALTTGTTITTGKFWKDATPATLITWLAGSWNVVASDVLEKIATADLSAGKITYFCWWYPLSDDGNVVAA